MRNANVNAYIIEMWVNMILDMGETPYLTVNTKATQRHMELPLDFVVDDHITLNVSPSAVGGFHIDKELGFITFGARFNRVHRDIVLPCEAVEHVRSRESGNGSDTPPHMMFYKDPENIQEDLGILSNTSFGSEEGQATHTESPDCAGHSKPVKKDRSFLKVVK